MPPSDEMPASPSPSPHRPARLEVPDVGPCLLPHEFAIFTGQFAPIELHDAREPAQALHARLAAGAGLVLTGPYAYADAVFHYCQHFQRGLVGREECANVADRTQRSAAFTAARWRKLHRLFLPARGDNLLRVQEPPETTGLQEWLERPTGEAVFLIPLRRLQRILTDMRRAREGLALDALGGTITILPHVYVPSDQSVPAMFADFRHLIAGRRVLDVGTGTGVLALLAARLGAAGVVATDSNPKAVANARLNVQRWRLEEKVDVRGPGDLFEPVGDEGFDVILFNAPWICGQPQTLYDTAVYDPDYRVLDGFLRAAPGHLLGGGSILLQYSDVSQRAGAGGMDHLHSAIAANGLRVAAERSIARTSRVLGARETVFLLELRRNE